jgi:hypothetical protein
MLQKPWDKYEYPDRQSHEYAMPILKIPVNKVARSNHKDSIIMNAVQYIISPPFSISTVQSFQEPDHSPTSPVPATWPVLFETAIQEELPTIQACHEPR